MCLLAQWQQGFCNVSNGHSEVNTDQNGLVFRNVYSLTNTDFTY